MVLRGLAIPPTLRWILARVHSADETTPSQLAQFFSKKDLVSINCTTVKMKVASSMLGYVTYEPWERPGVRSNKKVRAKYRPLPVEVLTCFDINSDVASCSKVVFCSSCDRFIQEKTLLSHLRLPPSNKNTTHPSRGRSSRTSESPPKARHQPCRLFWIWFLLPPPRRRGSQFRPQ
jgi:hypothetical protein